MDKDCTEMCHCNAYNEFVCAPKTCANKDSCAIHEPNNVHLCSPGENC